MKIALISDVHANLPALVSYDVEQAAQAIIASELPIEFADFLRSGGTAN